MIATIFESDCGATTDFSTSVNLRKNGQPFTPLKNLVIGVAGRQALNVTWQNDSMLIVAVPKNAETRVKETEVTGVTISYTAID